MTTEVAVLIPGIMGTELMDAEGMVWPGTAFELFSSYDKLDRLLSNDTVVGDIIRSFAFVPQYAALIKVLRSCEFQEDAVPKTLFVCPYDWRRSNALAASLLADLLDKVALVPDARIVLIAHSMGGLVARYYLESGQFDSRKGFGLVQQLITLGTPHRGAPMALLGAVGEQKRLFLSKGQVAQIGADPRFPSLYELLPPQGEPFIWDESLDSRFAPVDLYEGELSAKLNLNPVNLETAKAFRAELDMAKRPAHVGYFFFAGTEQRTISEVRYLLRPDGQPRLRAIERDNGGDGTVPVWSAMQQNIQTAPVGGEHGTIYRDGALLSVLTTLLGKPGVAAAALPAAQLSLRDPVVEPGDDVWAVLGLAAPSASIEGDLTITLVTKPDGTPVNPKAPPPPVSTQALVYQGPGADRLNVRLVAPDLPGGYRVEFKPAGNAKGAADSLIVQG